MESIQFHQQNSVIGKNQPEYRPLYAYINSEQPEVPATMCFLLSKEEIDEINATGKLWFTQLTFGKPFSPVMLQTQNPFEDAKQVVSKPLNERLEEAVFNRIHESIGSASMCWESPEKAGIFHSEQASRIAYELCQFIADKIEQAKGDAQLSTSVYEKGYPGPAHKGVESVIRRDADQII